MGAFLFRSKILPEQKETFFYFLLDDLKNVRILVDSAPISVFERTRILIELERAEKRVKGALKAAQAKIEQENAAKSRTGQDGLL